MSRFEPIPALRPITNVPRSLNKRLWELVNKDLAGTTTLQERSELDALCNALEAEEC
jgi:hypothetical protein